MKERICFIAGTLAVFFLMFILILNIPYGKFEGSKLTLARDTTWFTEPVRPDGGIDYARALNQRYSEGVTLENNLCARIFLVTPPSDFGASEDQGSVFEARFASALGYKEVPERIDLPDPVLEVTDQRYAELERRSPSERRQKDENVTYEEIDLQISQEYDLVQNPWRAAEFPQWAEVLKLQKPALDLMVSASKLTGYYHPIATDEVDSGSSAALIGALMPVAQRTRQVARALRFRAMNSIAEDRVEAAIEDIKSIRRIALLQSRSMTLVEKLVSIACFGIALQAEEQLLASGKLSVEQLEDYYSFLSSHRCPVETARHVEECERAIMLDQIQSLQLYGKDALFSMGRGKIEGPAAAAIQMLLNSADLTQSMRSANRMYDRFVKSCKQPTLKGMRDSAHAFQNELEDLERNVESSIWKLFRGPKTRGDIIGQVVCLMMLPHVTGVLDAEIRTVLHEEVTLAAIAITRYRKDHDEFPENLGALVPRYVNAVPVDPLNESPLKYDRTDDGYLVYSIGLDGIDNNGRREDETARRNEFDLRVCVGATPDYETGSLRDSKVKDAAYEKEEIERRKQLHLKELDEIRMRREVEKRVKEQEKRL